MMMMMMTTGTTVLTLTHLGLIPTNHTTLHVMTMTGATQDAQAAIAKASTIITTDIGSTFRDLDRHRRHLIQPREARQRAASLVQRVASLVPRVERVVPMGTTTMTMIAAIRTMATVILRTMALDMDQDTTQDMVMMIGVGRVLIQVVQDTGLVVTRGLPMYHALLQASQERPRVARPRVARQRKVMKPHQA